MCKHSAIWQDTFLEADGSITVEYRLEDDHSPYRVAICRLEGFITNLVTANHRFDWVFNRFLNYSWFTDYYWRIKKVVFHGFKGAIYA